MPEFTSVLHVPNGFTGPGVFAGVPFSPAGLGARACAKLADGGWDSFGTCGPGLLQAAQVVDHSAGLCDQQNGLIVYFGPNALPLLGIRVDAWTCDGFFYTVLNNLCSAAMNIAIHVHD